MMTNEQFVQYLHGKISAIKWEIDRYKSQGEPVTALENVLGLYESSLKIMTYGSGPAKRRHKRDYLRRLEKAGIKL